MKILDILIEDVKSERRLELIADQILSAIDTHFKAHRGEEPEDEFIGLGRINDVVDSKTLGPFYNRLGKIVLFYNKTVTTADGEFYIGPPKEMVIYYPVIVERGKERLNQTKSHVQSVIVHELRHALDYSLSKGKAFDSKGVRGASEADPDRDRDRGEYHRTATEVNARTSQAMLQTKRLMVNAMNSGEELNNAKLKELILKAMDDAKLVHIFKSTDEKAFKQLFNRIFKYAQDFLQQLPGRDNE
jgi:hypothetical protein